MNHTAFTRIAAAAALSLAALLTAGGAAAQAAKPDMTDAEIRRIDKDAKKLTLKHGPIKNLDMPAMTMVFQVKDAALLDKLSVGQKIRFTAEQQQGAYVVTGVEAAP